MRKYASAFALLFLTGSTCAQSQTARPEFEVASIKPNTSGDSKATWGFPPRSARFTATNIDLKTLIKLAYKLKDSEVAGVPAWVDSHRFDIAAKPSDSNATLEQSRAMLRTLLEDRFGLKIHRETREIPLYALMPARNGLRLPNASEGTCVEFGPNGQPPRESRLAPCGGFVSGPNLLAGGRVSTAQLVDVLSNMLDRRVLDKTGFAGTFNVRLEFTPPDVVEPAADAGNADRPTLFTAIQEQLGLRLESQKAPADVLVIDSLERVPTAN